MLIGPIPTYIYALCDRDEEATEYFMLAGNYIDYKS